MMSAEHTLRRAADCIHQQRFSEAEKLYQEVLVQNPAEAQALNGMGALAMQQQHYDKALAYFNATHKHLPANVDVIANMGTALYHLHQLENAAICYRQALALNRRHAAALDGLGLVLMQQGKHSEAEHCFLQAAANNPDYWLTFLHLGDLYRTIEQLNQAVECYEKALEKRPGAFEIMVNLGTALNNMGRSNEALSWYRRALAMEPNHLITCYNMAGVLFALRRFDELLDYTKHLENETFFSQEEKSGFHVHACLIHYLRDTVHEATAHLARAAYIKTTATTFPNARVLKIYYAYLLKLLDYRSQHSEWYTGKNDKILHVIGESHCLSPAYTIVKAYRCVPYLTSGVKAWHLAQEQHNRYKEMLNIAIQDIPENGTILACYGEIDCRRDEGIFPHYKENPGLDLKQSIATLVANYVEYIVAQAKRKNLRVFFCGVPAIAKDVSDMIAHERKTLAFIVEHFNACLAKEAVIRHVGFVDVYHKTATLSGFADGSCHIDAYHLLPHIVAEALTETL